MLLLSRLKPFFRLSVVFIALQAVLRAALLVRESDVIDIGVFGFIKLFSAGLLLDIGTVAYALIPISLYCLFLPGAIMTTRAHRTAMQVLYFITIYFMLFTAVSEWLFWDEFRTRFNFIAVDYLIYMDEVVGNIRESYPLPTYLSALLVIAAGIFWLTRRWIFTPHMLPPANLTQRWGMASAMLVLPAASFFLIGSSISEISRNSFANDIAKNGVYELFAAFSNNELNYDQFYLKEDDARIHDNLSRLMAAEPDSSPLLQAGSLKRRITARNPEIRPNIILITVESLSADYLGTFGNQENLTPYLDSLARESMFFTNFYAIGTRTVYGLQAITLSQPPIPGNAIVRRPGNENLFSLGALLKDRGYDSRFIYGGFGYFDNMNYFFGNNGYDIVDRANLAKEEISFANIWGVCDEDLFNRTLKESDDSYARGKPFFQMVMTTSNHRPFTYPDGKIDIPSPGGRKGGVKYTDYAIQQLLERAKTKPWFDNTIFVIVADHTAGSAGKSELQPSKYHIPLFIYAPKLIAPQKIDALASQIDLAPTLLSLLGVSYDSKFLGHDILASRYERAFIGSYQKLGYLTPDALTILKPVRGVSFYHRNGDELSAKEEANPEHLLNALSYFQTASQWRRLGKVDVPAPAAAPIGGAAPR